MIGLISCSAQKARRPASARELYTSTLFRLSLAYAERYCRRTYVLSALHGLVDLDSIVVPYNQRLSGVRLERDRWAAGVVRQLAAECPDGDEELLVLAGADYAAPLVAAVRDAERAGDISLPLAGLQIGERLRFLSRDSKAAA